jgi:hypothetical protein
MELFREFLKKNRKVKLTYNGKRYKAISINNVTHAIIKKDPCVHCGYGQRSVYMVSTNDICFCVDCWEGCLTYSEYAEIIPFEAGSQKEYDIICEKFKKVNNDNSEKSSSESSNDTDSY